jgi:hypothetical protein
MCTLGDAADVNPVIKFLRHALRRHALQRVSQIANMVQRDLDNISSHISNNSVPSHSHVRAIFVDSVGSLFDKIESSILYTVEELDHSRMFRLNTQCFAWFNFGEYSKEGPRTTQVLNSSAKVCL